MEANHLKSQKVTSLAARSRQLSDSKYMLTAARQQHSHPVDQLVRLELTLLLSVAAFWTVFVERV